MFCVSGFVLFGLMLTVSDESKNHTQENQNSNSNAKCESMETETPPTKPEHQHDTARGPTDSHVLPVAETWQDLFLQLQRPPVHDSNGQMSAFYLKRYVSILSLLLH
jgi:hypothetical protein